MRLGDSAIAVAEGNAPPPEDEWVVPESVVDQLSKVIDEKIDSIGELVAENERLKRRVGALGSEDPAENPSD